MSLNLHEVEAGRRAAVAEDAITASNVAWKREHRKPRALTAREALMALQFEALLVYVAAANLRNGIPLSDADMDRLGLAVRRIDVIAQEAA